MLIRCMRIAQEWYAVHGNAAGNWKTSSSSLEALGFQWTKMPVSSQRSTTLGTGKLYAGTSVEIITGTRVLDSVNGEGNACSSFLN